ncbi:MAG TPA: DNA polymerase IV [Pseudonocardiaceae bacterium]|jgi:DNA polymerase-4|nr:DNA polymerase IV [Pseudonocardiaceae bacterium]
MGRSADLPRVDLPRADLLRVHRAGAQRADDSGCPVLHVDMDAFYASVEVRERPELTGRPVVVAGGSNPAGDRGVVLSASYEARAFGVRSAMPVAQARRLCPQAEFVPPHFPRYTEVSRGVMALFREITPLVEPLSLDEAFLDVGGSVRRLGMSPAGIGEWVRGQVYDAYRVTCSVGVARSKFLAKLASGLAKPDGLLVVPVDGVLEFLYPLPVSALWGVGQRTAQVLHRLGCRTVADVASTPLPALRRAVGDASARHLHELANGRDERRVVPDVPEKSVGAEETFAQDVADRVVLRRELLRLVERTTATLRGRGLRGRTITLKVRYPDFTTVTRSRTLAAPTDSAQEVFGAATDLLDGHLPHGVAVRLLGVRVEQLAGGGAAEQLTLDGGTANGGTASWTHAERAADAARSKFGSAAVRLATLLDEPGRADPVKTSTRGETGAQFG